MPSASSFRRRSIYVLAIVVGAVAGLGAIGFEAAAAAITRLALVEGAGYVPGGPRGELRLLPATGAHTVLPLALLVMPALGCWISAMVSQWFAPEARGHGTDAAIDAYHQHGGRIRGRVPIVKGLCSAVTLGCGGSGGREGPIAQIGAGFGSFLAQRLGLGERACRTLLAAGMAGGVGAIFRAPFAGALFAAEILYRDAELETEVVMPAFLSSAVAYCVFCGTLGEFGTMFAIPPNLSFQHVGELLPYTLLALVLVPMIAYYTRFFYASERWFHALRAPRPLVAALGGLATGAIALFAWWLAGDDRALCVLANGYGVLQDMFDGKIVRGAGIGLLLLVAICKVLATSCTIASGGSAGVFGPSMVIGGATGGAVGIVCHTLGLVDQPEAFCIVGMCGFFAGAAKTPISTIVMVTEMTGSYRLLLPAVWVCGLTFLLSRQFALYRKQVQNRAFSPAHRGEYVVDLLERMTVADVFEASEVEVVHPNTPLRGIVQRIAASKQDYFPVVDERQQFLGMLSAHDVRQFTFDESVYELAIASDVMTSPPVVLRPTDDLHHAIETFDSVWLDELPVVAADDPHRLLGRLRRRAINRAYKKRLDELRADRDRESR